MSLIQFPLIMNKREQIKIKRGMILQHTCVQIPNLRI